MGRKRSYCRFCRRTHNTRCWRLYRYKKRIRAEAIQARIVLTKAEVIRLALDRRESIDRCDVRAIITDVEAR